MIIKELIISINNKEIISCILEDGRLSTIYKDFVYHDYSVGSVYKGVVKNFIPGLNAAFIDIGYFKDAFLHYQDLGSQFKSFIKFYYCYNKYNKYYGLGDFLFEKDINKNGRIEDVLSLGQDLIVQVIKEPLYNKGPKITASVSISGQYLIILPFSNSILFSKKIKNTKEKKRILNIIKDIIPFGFGVIVRTKAEYKSYDVIKSDFIYLENKWNNLFYNFYHHRKLSTCKILDSTDPLYSLVRDTCNLDFTSIICDNENLYFKIRSYLSIIDISKIDIIYLYDNLFKTLFEAYSIERQIKFSLGKYIPILNGSYIILEHTEALHVIDVNSGSDNKNKFTNYDLLKINLLSAQEISRQLKLRDIGGIIVIDFIDMKNSIYLKKLYNFFKSEIKKDVSKCEILPPSKFGLIQLTRHRIRKEFNFNSCNIESFYYNDILLDPISHIREIENLLLNYTNKYTGFKICYLHTHPFVASYLKYGFISLRLKWFFIYSIWIIIISRYSFYYTEYKFIRYI